MKTNYFSGIISSRKFYVYGSLGCLKEIHNKLFDPISLYVSLDNMNLKKKVPSKHYKFDLNGNNTLLRFHDVYDYWNKLSDKKYTISLDCDTLFNSDELLPKNLIDYLNEKTNQKSWTTFVTHDQNYYAGKEVIFSSKRFNQNTKKSSEMTELRKIMSKHFKMHHLRIHYMNDDKHNLIIFHGYKL